MTIAATSRKTRLSAALVLIALALTIEAGPLDPPGPPGEPTMMPIDQIDPRIPIHAGDLPLAITQPGSYYLAENIVATGPGIIVQADRVTLDLMGFTLAGGTGPGIDGSGQDQITVRNGIIQGWSGTGVRLQDNAVLGDLVVRENGGSGIDVGWGARVVGCTVQENAVHGIMANANSLVKDCVVSVNTENGIWVGTAKVLHCVSNYNGRNGIRAEDNASIIGNHIIGNDQAATGKAGVWLLGSRNRVEGNTILENAKGIEIDGDSNVVVRNIVGGSAIATVDVDPTAVGNFIPLWSVGSSGSPDPWANIEQP